MDELINANYIADLKSIGRKDKLLSITAKDGDNIFINGSPKRCETHFEVLCGLRRPDVGEVKLCGRNPYEMNAKEAAAFRRDTIGAVPQDLGLFPELRMIDQIALPMQLAGVDDETIIAEIRKLTSELMPLHNLFNIPGNVPNPVNMPNHCYFKERCSKCTKKCSGEYPGMVQVSPTHFVACHLYGEEEQNND